MNTKTLRKNYKKLSEDERLSMFISAAIRNDESEENAIMAASPKVSWEKADFGVRYEMILCLISIVTIYKAEAWITWQYFVRSEDESDLDHARLALYILFLYSDALAVISKELKFDGEGLANAFYQDNSNLMRVTSAEHNCRKNAFTEAEAREFAAKFEPEGKFGLTLESKIKEFREFLEPFDE